MNGDNFLSICNTTKDNTNTEKSSKLTCTACNKSFQWRSGLSRHFKLFHLQNKDKKYKCNICDKLFFKQVGLSMHLKQHSFKMELLKKQSTVNNIRLTKNIKIYNDSIISKPKKISHLYANIVSETVYSSDSDCEYEILQTATKLKNPDSKSEYQCQFCEKNFIKSSSLQMHLKRHDQDKQATDKEQTKDTDNLADINVESCKTDENERRYLCKKCNKTFKLSRNLANHLKIHLKQSIVARKELMSHNLMNIKPRYSCPLCDKIYFKQIHLDNHLTIHTNQDDENEEKQHCPECNKKFGKKAMELHKQTHLPAKPYLCMVCGKGYSRSGYLSIHMRTHSNYRPHLCSVCGKSFTIKRYLIIHSRTHTQERPFTCQHCNKGFIQKGNLIEHLRIHSGIKPHICAVCGKRFTHYSGLTQHLLTHSSVKRHICKICGKAFRQGGHYREHMRIHSGDRPFVCNICSRGFASSSSLIVHSRTHSGERPYKCLVCKKGFIKSYGLKQHKKTHTMCNIPESIA